MTLTEALKRLDVALTTLEVAAARRIETERRSADLTTELALMQDDRARLAVELDGTLAKLGRMEAVTDEVDRRLERAMNTVHEVLSHGEAPDEPRAD